MLSKPSCSRRQECLEAANDTAVNADFLKTRTNALEQGGTDNGPV